MATEVEETEVKCKVWHVGVTTMFSVFFGSCREQSFSVVRWCLVKPRARCMSVSAWLNHEHGMSARARLVKPRTRPLGVPLGGDAMWSRDSSLSAISLANATRGRTHQHTPIDRCHPDLRVLAWLAMGNEQDSTTKRATEHQFKEQSSCIKGLDTSTD